MMQSKTMRKWLHCSLIIASCSLITACDFHLRGTVTPAISDEYKTIQLQMPAAAESLRQPLSVYLKSLGATVVNDSNKTAPVLRITEYQPIRQLLSGRLTEVQLTLKVTFHMENSEGQQTSEERTIYSYRSYQYDIETVNTDNQQETHLRELMYQDVAYQIARLLHADRLPHITPTDDSSTDNVKKAQKAGRFNVEGHHKVVQQQ